MKRPKLQFALRTMLAAFVILSVMAARISQRARKQQLAVAWLSEVGVLPSYDCEFENNDIPTWQIAEHFKPNVKPLVPSWIIDSVGFDWFHCVLHVNLAYYDGRDLSQLSNLPGLLSLDLCHSPSANLCEFRDLPHLRYLNLWNSNIDSVTSLSHNHELKWLDISNSRVVDVSALNSLCQLQELYLCGLTIESGLLSLVTLERLQQLDLTGSDYSEAELEQLKIALPACDFRTD